jgi:hypothetical protein
MRQMQGRFGYCLLAALLATAFLVAPAAAFEAKLSGQVNQMMMWADDGNEDDFFVADNTNSSTRFRFTGSTFWQSDRRVPDRTGSAAQSLQ